MVPGYLMWQFLVGGDPFALRIYLVPCGWVPVNISLLGSENTNTKVQELIHDSHHIKVVVIDCPCVFRDYSERLSGRLGCPDVSPWVIVFLRVYRGLVGVCFVAYPIVG